MKRVKRRKRFLKQKSLRERFSELFPDQELLTLTAPGSCPDDQIESLQKAAGLLSALNKK